MALQHVKRPSMYTHMMSLDIIHCHIIAVGPTKGPLPVAVKPISMRHPSDVCREVARTMLFVLS